MKTIKNASKAIFAVALITSFMTINSCRKADDAAPTDPNNQSGSTQGVVWRPFSDYLNNQGTTTYFIPPVPDNVGWITALIYYPIIRFADVDYNGTTAKYLAANGGPVINTTVTGTVKEQPYGFGQAKVTVKVHAENALAFGSTLDLSQFNPYANSPLDFGTYPADLLANPSLPYATGWADLSVTFINPSMGAPIPDLTFLTFGIIDITFHSKATGILHSPSGFPEGSKGSMKVDQVGLFKNPNWLIPATTRDNFPVEHIIYSLQ